MKMRTPVARPVPRRLKGIVTVLRKLKRSVHDGLSVRLTYHPAGQVHVEAGQTHVLGLWSEGGLRP